MKKYTIILVNLLLLLTNLYAQQSYTISGYIKSSVDHTPLSGATISISDESAFATTDSSGYFQINSHIASPFLSINYVGWETVERKVHQGENIEILLTPANKSLDDVVTVAYTNVKKSGYPGAVSTITADKINNRLTPDLSNALQGQVAGLQTASANGQPGNGSTLRVRGIGSINASSAPLIILDGAQYNGDINSLNVADIETVNFLKDAVAANLYGSEAANGVIIITTKKGNKNKTSVNATLVNGWSSRAVRDYDQVNTDQYFQLYWQALKNKQLTNGLSDADAAKYASDNVVSDLGINPYGPGFADPVDNNGQLVAGARPLWNDSWKDALTQVGKYQQAQLSLSGGNDKSTYYVSAGALNNQGSYIYSGFKRYNLRSNFTINANKWLSAGADINMAYTNQDYPASSDSRTDNVALNARLIPGFYPIYERSPDGTYKLDNSGQKIIDYGNYRPSGALARENLLGSLPLDKSQNQNDNVSLRAFAKAQITKQLYYKTTFNVDYINANKLYYTNPLFGDNASIGGTINKESGRTLSYTYNNILDYTADFNSVHHLDLLAGQEYYHYGFSVVGGDKQNFALPGFYEPDAASVLNDFYGHSDTYNKLSYFGQAQYNYLEKYYVTGSIRRDGSSRFSEDSRWGTFWSVGASWRIAQESFLKDVSWLNALTLKASYGGSGNDNLGSYYDYLALYAFTSNLGNGGVVTSSLATPDLVWESNLNGNISLDFGLFKNRISGTLSYYDRRSKDLLFAKPLAPSTGFSSIDANIGSIKNSGFEIELNAIPVQTKNFEWNLSINASHNKNEITSLPQGAIISGTKRMAVGKSVYDFYLREWAGVDKSTGDPLWYISDETGKKTTTSVYSDASQYYVGNALPDLVGGVNNTLKYKGFDFSFLLSYSLGGKVLDGDFPMLLSGGADPGSAMSAELLNSWTVQNPNTNVPRLTTDDNSWTSSSTRFLYNATYARLKSVTLGYSFPTRWLSATKALTSLRIYGAAENLLTFFGHQGMDPEQSISGTTYFQYPTMKTVSIGLQAGF